MVDRGMTLDAWLSRENISAEKFGETVGCSGQAVRRWRCGARMPDAASLEKIVAATGGAVTVQAMHETRLAHLRENKEPDPLPSSLSAA